MSEGVSPRRGYSFTYRSGSNEDEGRALEQSQIEDLKYIQESIMLLTGGCEVCQHSVGPFCKKRKHAIEPGDPRCEDFVRRFPGDPKAASDSQVRRYLNDRLGIGDEKSVRRIAGMT